MGKMTERKRWEIFFEMLKRKQVMIILILAILLVGLTCNMTDLHLIFINLIRNFIL